MTDETDEQFLNAHDSSEKSDGLESWEVACQKYKTEISVPITADCEVCGEKISSTHEWFLHHFTDWHRRVVRWVDAFRSRCIDQQDEDGATKFDDAVAAVKDQVLYTQELFEIGGRLFCCACAKEVRDIAEHLGSTRHNELVLSIVDSSAFVRIKEETLKADRNRINKEVYHQQILNWLAEELPPTADSPLEVVVLKNDGTFLQWFEKYSCALNNIRVRNISASPTDGTAPLCDMPAEASGVKEESVFGSALESSMESSFTKQADSNVVKSEALEVSAEPVREELEDLAADALGLKSLGANAEKKSSANSEANENSDGAKMEWMPTFSFRVDTKSSASSEPKENSDGLKVESMPTFSFRQAQIPELAPGPTQSTASPALDTNKCFVCDFPWFTKSSFLKHTAEDDHLKRMKIHDFLRSEGQFVVGAEPATVQAQFDASADDFLGLSETYEMYDAQSNLRFWICGQCYCGLTNATGLVCHLQGIKHKKRYIDCQYPEKRRKGISNTNEMTEWINETVKDIASLEGKGKLKYAIVVAANISEILKAVGFSEIKANVETAAEPTETERSVLPASIGASPGPSTEEHEAKAAATAEISQEIVPVQQLQASPVVVETNGNEDTPSMKPAGIGETAKPVVQKAATAGPAPEEKPFKEISVGSSNVVLQCEACWDVLITNEKEKSAKWLAHVTSSDHRKKLEARKQWKFDPERLTNAEPSPNVIKAVEQAAKSSSEVVIVGLNDIVEIRKAKSSDGANGDINVVCLTCAELMKNTKALSSHLASRAHKMKYLSKHYPEEVATVFKGLKDTTFKEIGRFLVDRGARAGVVQVYDPNFQKTKPKAGSEPKSSSTSTVPKKAPSIKSPTGSPKKKLPSAGTVSSEKKNTEPKKAEIKKEPTDGKAISIVKNNVDKDVTILAEVKKLSAKQPSVAQKANNGTATTTSTDTAKTAVSSASGTTLVDSLAPKIADTSPTKSKAESTDRKEWIYIAPIHDDLNEPELVKVLQEVISTKVKSCVIRRAHSGRRYAIINAGENAGEFIKKLNGNTLPGFPDQLTVEYSSDQKTGEPEEDLGIKLLMGSPSATIPIRYHAFAQPLLDECKEPLVGVEEVYEFCCRDLNYEPAYLCKLCRMRCNANVLIAHLISIDHRLKYFEAKHPSIYHSLTSGTSSSQRSVLQALAIKQHAQAIELQDGRSRISQRLTIQVGPVPYGMKKNVLAAQSPTVSVGNLSSSLISPSFFSVPPPTRTAFNSPFGVVTSSVLSKPGPVSPMLPPGVSQSDGASSSTLLDRVTAPFANAPLPPGVSAEDHFSSLSSAKGSRVEPTDWKKQCDRFLAQLSSESSKNPSIGVKEPSKSTPSSSSKKVAKPDESSKKVVQARTEIKSQSSGSRERSRDRSRERGRKRSRSRSRSRRSKSRSRSKRSRSRSRQRTREERKRSGRSPSPKSSDTKGKAKSPKLRSPTKTSPTKKDVSKRRRSKSPGPTEKKKARLDSQSAKESPSKKNAAKSIELPDLLKTLTELVKAEKKQPPPTKPKSSPPTSALGALLGKMMAERASASASTSASADSGMSRLLSMLGKRDEAPKPSRTQTQPSASDMSVLVKMLASEEDRQRRLQDQQHALFALLSSKLTPNAAESSTASGQGPMVIDYGHSSQKPQLPSVEKTPAAHSQPHPLLGHPSGGKNTDASDELVNEALRNVLKAQGASSGQSSQPRPAVRVIRQSTPSGARPPFLPVDLSRPPPPRPPQPFGNFPRPGPPLFPPQASTQNQQASAIMNAAAAVLLNTIFNQSLPPRNA